MKKDLKQRLKKYFLDNPAERLRVRQIGRKLEMPLPSVIRYAKELDMEGILRKESISGITLYSADRTNDDFIFEKRIHNLRKVKESGLIRYLREEFSNPTVILFGSFEKGEDIPESDIDIYIEIGKESLDLQKFEKILGKSIQKFLFSDISLIKNKNLANNIINGTLLNGSLEVF
ncbi:MAG: nucleotidyltransferase domain-containing protein [Nanobdellota archaeon]